MKVAETPQQELAPSPDALPQKPQKPKEAAAPKEASTQIVPEAPKNATAQTNLSTAPRVSPRPMERPPELQPVQAATANTSAPTAKPDKQPKADATAENKKAQTNQPSKSTASAVDAALAAAMASTSGDQNNAPTANAGNGLSAGPPMTSADSSGLLAMLGRTWIVDPGSPSAGVTVTVAFSLLPTGKVIPDSVKLVSATGGNEAAQRTAYEAARRAILHGSDLGFQLPPAKYQQWKEIEMVFDPNGMRLQ